MGQDRSFVHLHVHSDYSRLDGMSAVSELVDLAADQGSPAIALTDHGTMGGVSKLFLETRRVKNERGIDVKPIPGYEAYQTEDRFAKGNVGEGKANYHLILLAYTNQGYRNLMKISSRASLESRYGGRPRVDLDLIREYSEGLIATTGCLGSMVNQNLLNGRLALESKNDTRTFEKYRQRALRAAQDMIDVVGRENYYVEVQKHHFHEQDIILQDQKWLADELDLPLLATNDSHYNHREDAETHEALLCAQTGDSLDNPDRFKFASDENYFRSPDEMHELFPDDEWVGACENTVKLAERVNVSNPVDNGHLLPQFPIPEGFDDSEEYLRHLTYEGAKNPNRYGNKDGVLEQRVIDQIEHELGIIHEMGFDDYFLILSSTLKWAKSNNIAIGPGRGSAAGSIVAYCTYITNVDPLAYGLYFERFLNPGRGQMPDIDVDVAKDRREEFLTYLTEVFGQDRVAHIATYGAFATKSAIQVSARVLGYPASVTREINSQISGFDPPLWVLLEEDKSKIEPEQKRGWKNAAGIRALKSKYNDIFNLALSLTGVISSQGMHAGGILITPGPVTDYFPVREGEKDGIQICEFDKDDTEAFGGLKIDYLGLTNLSIIRRAVHLIEKDLGEKVDIDNLPLDDPAVYRMIANGDNEGVFQLNKPGIQDWVRAMAPTEFEDLSAMGALNRPGPMESNVHYAYADRKNGRSEINVPHEDMRKILDYTYGLVVYQEQVMQLAQHYAGYDTQDADNFRRAMGKKKASAMAEQHDKFFAGCIENGYSQELAQELWDIIEPFSGYAFNKAHSVAYAFISYQTAYLKCHYPAQYAAAMISYSDDGQISNQIESCRKQNINLYAPDINKSDHDPTTSNDSIWIGLNSIRQCGFVAREQILDERQRNGSFKSLPDFLKRVVGGKINKSVVKNLINVGAFDNLHTSRKLMDENVEAMLLDAKKIVNAQSNYNEDDNLFDFGGEVETKDALDYYVLDGEDYTDKERLSNEIELLGFFVGTHPFNSISRQIATLKENGSLPEDAFEPDPDKMVASEDTVAVYGVLTNLKHTTRKKSPRTDFVIESSYTNRVNVIRFGEHVSDHLQGNLVLVEGRLQSDNFSESDELVLMANNVTLINASDENNKTSRSTSRSRRGRGGLKVIDGGKSVRQKAQEQDDAPVQVETTTNETEQAPRNTEEKYRIFLDSEHVEMIGNIAQEFTSKGPGSSRIIFVLNDNNEEVSSDNMRFNLVDNDVSLICSKFDINYEKVS